MSARHLTIGGFVPLTLSDFPGHVACEVFTQGCTFRCPWCHNPHLIPREGSPDSLTCPDSVFAYLDRRKGQIDGVVITGGEPTMQESLIPFIEGLRQRSVKIKLDTNGSRPDVLRLLLTAGLVHYVALDIKAPWNSYDRLTGTEGAVPAVQHSLDLLIAGGTPFEIRTTLVTGLLTEEDLMRMASELPSVPRWYLQPFSDERVLNPDALMVSRDCDLPRLDGADLARRIAAHGRPCSFRSR